MLTPQIYRSANLEIVEASSLPLLPGVRGVMVIVVGNGHVDTSSNPGRD